VVSDSTVPCSIFFFWQPWNLLTVVQISIPQASICTTEAGCLELVKLLCATDSETLSIR